MLCVSLEHVAARGSRQQAAVTARPSAPSYRHQALNAEHRPATLGFELASSLCGAVKSILQLRFTELGVGAEMLSLELL